MGEKTRQAKKECPILFFSVPVSDFLFRSQSTTQKDVQLVVAIYDDAIESIRERLRES